MLLLEVVLGLAGFSAWLAYATARTHLYFRHCLRFQSRRIDGVAVDRGVEVKGTAKGAARN
jgi:hypothetical protein